MCEGRKQSSWVFSSSSTQPGMHHHHMTFYMQLQLFLFSFSTDYTNPIPATGRESEQAVMNIQMQGGIRAVSVWIKADHIHSQPRNSVWERDQTSYTPSDSFAPFAVTLSIKTATSVCWCRSLPSDSDGTVMIYLCSDRWADWLTLGKLI